MFIVSVLFPSLLTLVGRGNVVNSDWLKITDGISYAVKGINIHFVDI